MKPTIEELIELREKLNAADVPREGRYVRYMEDGKIYQYFIDEKGMPVAEEVPQ